MYLNNYFCSMNNYYSELMTHDTPLECSEAVYKLSGFLLTHESWHTARMLRSGIQTLGLHWTHDSWHTARMLRSGIQTLGLHWSHDSWHTARMLRSGIQTIGLHWSHDSWHTARMLRSGVQTLGLSLNSWIMTHRSNAPKRYTNSRAFPVLMSLDTHTRRKKEKGWKALSLLMNHNVLGLITPTHDLMTHRSNAPKPHVNTNAPSDSKHHFPISRGL